MSAPSSIAHYRVTAKLGEGGMGTVYRATDTKLNREVAMKVLPDSFANDADRLARFTREAQVLASLNHPNIAAIYGVEERAIVMELVEGESPAGPMPAEDALPVVAQLIDALEYAHDKGIVHRDLKPANLKLTPERRLKVLDFGLAKALASESVGGNPMSSPTLTMRATQAGAIMGTAAYMAPEQARGQSVDKRADIWSFGVVVYELLTGKQLFAGETVSDTLAAVLTREPDLSGVPARFQRLIRLCLMRDPRQRLRDISGARLLLENSPAPAAAAAAGPKAPWIVAALAVTAALIFGLLWQRAMPVHGRTFRFTIESKVPLLFSPDGRWLLMLAKSGLQVRPLNAVSWRTLPGTEGSSDAFWSSDSSAIGYFSNGRLRTISLDGTHPRSIADVKQAGGGTWRGGAGDGQILFADGHRLKVLDLQSENVATLPIEFNDSQWPYAPVFCPEGDCFVYLLSKVQSYYSMSRRSVYRATLSTRGTLGERVVETPYAVRFGRHPYTRQWHLFYVTRDDLPGIANRTLMAVAVNPRTGAPKGAAFQVVDALANYVESPYGCFDVAEGGVMHWRRTTPSLPIYRLTWFDRNGNVMGSVGERAGYSSLALSPDESWIAAQQGYPLQHIWIYNAASGAARRLTSLDGSEGPPVWSRDSRAVYFVHQIDSHAAPQLKRQAIDPGSTPETVAELPGATSLQDLSPDGRYLLVAAITDSGILALDVAGPAESRTPRKVLFMGTRVRFSRDGRSILIYDKGHYYASAYPPADGGVREVAAFGAQAWPFFSVDGGQLFSIVDDDSVYSHPVLPLAGGAFRLGERSLLFKLHHARRSDANLGAVTRDGRRFLAIATESDEESQTQVLSDWTTLVK